MLTTNEQLVMLAIARGGKHAYALAIQDDMKKAGHGLTLGVLYTVLSRLEEERLIRRREGEGSLSHGDRSRRFYTLTAAGVRGLHHTLKVIDRLRTGAYSPKAK